MIHFPQAAPRVVSLLHTGKTHFCHVIRTPTEYPVWAGYHYTVCYTVACWIDHVTHSCIVSKQKLLSLLLVIVITSTMPYSVDQFQFFSNHRYMTSQNGISNASRVLITRVHLAVNSPRYQLEYESECVAGELQARESSAK